MSQDNVPEYLVLEYGRTSNDSAWRTCLAFALTAPAGVALGRLVWEAGFGSLGVLIILTPIATAGLCLLATQRRILVGFVFDIFVSVTLNILSLQFDRRMKKPIDFGEHFMMFVILSLICVVLSLIVSVPISRSRRQPLQ